MYNWLILEGMVVLNIRWVFIKGFVIIRDMVLLLSVEELNFYREK